MENTIKDFEAKVRNRKLTVAVVGLGYVGLPLAIEFAKKGFSCMGIDLDKDRIARLKKQESYITDVPSADLKKVLKNTKFRAEQDFRFLPEADVIFICVPTPLKKKHEPDISYIKSAVKSISLNMKRGALVILESTTYPGTTDEVIIPLLESGTLKHGKDFFLCFSPERIDPGNEQFPLHKIVKVIGGVSPEATSRGVAIYSTILHKIVPVSSARVAEMVKLLENTFRLINIGMINELAMMAHKMKIDIWEVIDAAKTKPFGFMAFYPGPGVGGHCIPKDPLYLYWKARKFGFKSKFIKLASQVITYMPEYVVERVSEILLAQGKKLKNSHILVVGATYKKDVKDLRKSPALDIIELLSVKAKEVSYYDPLIPFLKFNSIDLVSADIKNKISTYDCVVIATDHSVIDYGAILKKARCIFDTRNIYKNIVDQKIYKI
ncbi:MAG: nucleotide sugar dehydrogenase [Candidatus Omnitrophica bacterium]|nr:nucleotide sugar dehydrogenase [Candidatus Omnitrophota bacterium]